MSSTRFIDSLCTVKCLCVIRHAVAYINVLVYICISLFAHQGYTADETDPEVTRHFIESETVVCMTFKTVDTGEVVGAGLLLPATCSRTTTPIVSSGAMVVRPDFGAKGLGSVMMELWPTLSVSCGYDAVYGESHTKHTAVLHMAVKEGLRVIGCIPGTINLPTSGWGDTVVFYKSFGRYMKASNL